MSRRFVATISPSVDKMHEYLASALSHTVTLRNKPDLCLAQVRAEIEAALEYLSLFKSADEVLIPRFARVKGDIGQKRVAGEFDASDFSYREVYVQSPGFLVKTAEDDLSGIPTSK